MEWSAVKKGQDWSAIREALKTWILTKAPGLPDGRRVIDEGTIPGVPFGLLVTKRSHRPAAINFGRMEPEDNTLSARTRKQLDRKAAKLAKYHPEKTTVLLVESNDMAMMNHSKLSEAIEKAYSRRLPPGVDQLWYSDTSVPGAEVVFMDLTHDLCG